MPINNTTTIAFCAITLLISNVAGCAVVTVTGERVYARQWDRTVAALEKKAAFDLQCPAESLRYSLLKKFRRHPVEVGVEGCGSRIRYSRMISKGPLFSSAIHSWQAKVSSQSRSRPTIAPNSSLEPSF